MKHLLIFLSLLTLGHATPPRVRLLSASENTATIRVEKAASENHLTTLVDSLHSAGIHSFTFESPDQRLLQKLKPAWLDSGIKSIAIQSPRAPSAASFPTIDPIEAHAVLLRLDDEIDQATFQFEAHRKALVSFIHQHGKPEPDPTITRADLIAQQSIAQTQLDQFLAAPIETRLHLATQLDHPDNPVAKHLKAHQSSLRKKASLASTGVGPKHPELKALHEEANATRQLALDELATIEEALHLRLYQLTQRLQHLETWQQLPELERNTLRQSHHQKRSAYLTSLAQLRQLQAIKATATRSLR